MTEVNVLLQDNKGQYIHLNGQVQGLTALKIVALLNQLVLPPAGQEAPVPICGAMPRDCGIKTEGPFTPLGKAQLPSKIIGEVRFES